MPATAEQENAEQARVEQLNKEVGEYVEQHGLKDEPDATTPAGESNVEIGVERAGKPAVSPEPETKAPPVEQPPEQPAAPVEISAAQLERAKALGIEEAAAKAYESPDALESDLNRLQLIFGNYMARQQAQPAPPDGTQPPAAPPPAAPAPVPAPVQPPPAFELGAVSLEGLEDEPAAAIHRNVEGLHKHYSGELAAVRAQQKQLADAQEQVGRALAEINAMHQVQQMDAFISGLGSEYESLFGSGPSAALDQSSDAYRNRYQLFQARQVMDGSYRGLGLKAPGAFAVLRQALGASFPDQLKEIGTKAVVDRLRDTRGRFTAPPTSRDGSDSRSPEDRTRDEAKAYCAEHGIDY